MAGRIVDYKPVALRPFADVAEEVRRQLTRKAAADMAQKLGQEKLVLLEQGKTAQEAGVAFAPPVTLTRNQVQPGFSPDALTKVFQVDPAKVPQYAGATNERGGFSIYRVTKVIEPPSTDPARLAAAGRQIGDQIGRELFTGYLATLKAQADVKINQANLEKK
jgi:peptidyl-prolyl cis-trans isomerase D